MALEYISAVPRQALEQEQVVRRRRIVGAGSEGAFLDELGESGALAHVGTLVCKTPSASPRPSRNSHSLSSFFPGEVMAIGWKGAHAF